MELPLFPLGSVLFPGMPLKLHIFEERYQIMINECLAEKKPFGIVLIQSGREALGPLAKPYMVGTTAHITDVTRLPFGRMNILAVGRERFRVNSLKTDDPRGYLVGDVELDPMLEVDKSALEISGQRLRPLFERYLDARQQAGQLQFNRDQIPTDYRSLAFLAAFVLEMETEEKQALLEMETTQELMQLLISHYRREALLMEILLSPPDTVAENESPFSLN